MNPQTWSWKGVIMGTPSFLQTQYPPSYDKHSSRICQVSRGVYLTWFQSLDLGHDSPMDYHLESVSTAYVFI
jgi:hypothetical protein